MGLHMASRLSTGGKPEEPYMLIPALNRPLFYALKHNWPLYACEATELALFMLSACAFTIFLFDPSWPASHWFPSAVIRRALMGIAMGITAVLIIQSPMGKRSGAHFNPAITLTYFRLGKIKLWDAVFYVFFQFIGAVLGVAVAATIFGNSLSKPAVNYVITVPGRYGTAAAFFTELFMASVLMTLVLLLSNRVHLATYVSYVVGGVIVFCVFVFAPVSGFSINPARTTGSAFFAGVWTAGWLYFVAPLLGMFSAAEIYVRINGRDRVLCAKLHPDPAFPCPFVCRFPGHSPALHPHAEDIKQLAHGTDAP
jgi:aquaporin Z